MTRYVCVSCGSADVPRNVYWVLHRDRWVIVPICSDCHTGNHTTGHGCTHRPPVAAASRTVA